MTVTVTVMVMVTVTVTVTVTVRLLSLYRQTWLRITVESAYMHD
jgi:hypothetical protein